VVGWTSSVSQKAREQSLQIIQTGKPLLVIGTVAMLEGAFALTKPGLWIIDEQHRFGVEQREAFFKRGPFRAHELMVSATPIPRTLSALLFGSCTQYILRERPFAPRVETRLVGRHKYDDMLKYLDGAIPKGERVFWVLPRIQEHQEESPLVAMESLRKELMEKCPHWSLTCIFGNLDAKEKEKRMAQFASGESPVLLATTVIEVGVDVPAATLMVIENPECFGLSTLHQLRGRIGRSGAQGWCFLMVRPDLPVATTERLKAFAATTNGFELAEADLSNRGGGDLEGFDQSGKGAFRFVRLPRDAAMLLQALGKPQ
jgi:ATP-dependent DNA helicase RecG